MKRRFRLTKSSEFERVRRTGKSYAHPLIVLIAQSTPEQATRVGVSAGRSIGNAAERNRAKRRMRAAIQPLLADLLPGWDLILIARRPILEADYSQVQAALLQLLQRSSLLNSTNDHNHLAE